MNEGLNERLKELRLKEGLTQAELGKRIRCARNTIANYEMGKREPSNAVISLICKEIGVNEIWLRTGEGNMYDPINSDDRFSLNIGKLAASKDKRLINAVNALAETSPEKLKIVEDFMLRWLGIEN